MKHTDDLLIAKVFTCCLEKDSSIKEITEKCYGNDYAKNEIHVYKIVEYLVVEGFLYPVIKNGLVYSVNSDKIIKSLITNKKIIQIGNNKFQVVNKERIEK